MACIAGEGFRRLSVAREPTAFRRWWHQLARMHRACDREDDTTAKAFVVANQAARSPLCQRCEAEEDHLREGELRVSTAPRRPVEIMDLRVQKLSQLDFGQSL